MAMLAGAHWLYALPRAAPAARQLPRRARVAELAGGAKQPPTQREHVPAKLGGIDQLEIGAQHREVLGQDLGRVGAHVRQAAGIVDRLDGDGR